MVEPTVLDQPTRVKEIDKSNMLSLCEKMPDYCKDAMKRLEKKQISYDLPENIVIIGMGGSAIGGALLKDWLSDKASIPIEICRDYVLPRHADENTLAIAVSYSGETEETLCAFLEAARRNCMIATISTGGSLKTFSQKLKIPHVIIPTGFPPRAAIPYIFFSQLMMMEKIGIVKDISEVKETLRVLENLSKENGLQTSLGKNVAKKLATGIKGTIPIVYGFRQYSSVAQRIKCQFNENSKVPSKFDTFSELNHNEVVGWEASNDLTKPFSIILIRDQYEPPEIKYRIEITKQIATPKVSKILEIKATGQCKLARMCSSMYIGDFASIYLAILRGVDPTPTKTITYFKQKMQEKLDITKELEKEVSKIE